MINKTIMLLLLAPMLLVSGVHAQIVLSGYGNVVGENIRHPSGNIFDQVLLTGQSIKLQAKPGQITRVSFMDEDGDIVQVEFSGAGNFTVTLDPATYLPPAFPAKYNQDVMYVTGKPTVVIEGADATTFLSIFTVGRINAVDQALFSEGEVYDGEADVKLVEVINSTGMGGMQLSNTVFSGNTGKVGVDARGVPIAVRLTIGDIDASGDAVPYLLFGEGSFTTPASNPGLRITGGDLAQTNGAAIVVAESESTTPGFDTLISQNNFKSDYTPQPTLSIDATFTNEEGDEITVAVEELTIDMTPPIDPGLAPENEAAFNDLVVGQRLLSALPTYYMDFAAAGRFEETEGAATYTGSYAYSNTGPDTGTVVFNYDDGDQCTSNLTFVSATAGTSTYTCNDGESGKDNWQLTLIDTTSVVSLEISGTMPLTSIGQTIQLAATTHMLDGSSQAIASAFVHWVSSDPAVATVIDGTVTAVGPGNASTVATYQGQKAVAEISVHISARETGTVRVIYAAPSDREFRSDYRDAIQHAIVDLQSWYRRQLGGLTFSLYDATPELCQLSETSDYYDQDPWQKVLEGVQHCAPVEDNTSTFAWVIYADLEAVCGARGSLGRGGPGLTMVGRDDLEGLIGNRLVAYDECGRPYAAPVTRWIGGIGHELGHALGLPHPPGCDDGLPTCDRAALMDLGYTTYPDTYLRPDDKQVLWRSPFIEKNPSQRQLMEEAGIVAAIRGTVSDPGGEVVVGIRVSAVSDDFWAWGETASDGIFEIRLPDGSSGSSVLSVHAGGVADCGWLGYHVAGGLTTFREHATRIELGEVDPASIEISLPAISGELCQGQRTVTGTVLGPSGDPVGVFVGAFDQWSFSGDDGLFELRLPEGSGGSSPLLVEVPECGNVGFYGPGGFTTRFADSWQWEIGDVNVADIVIRLPATPEELCRRQPTIAGAVVGPDGEVMEGIGVVALPFWRWGTNGADGTFEIRLLEGTTGMPVLGIYADCGQVVGYYGPNGFTTSREDATGIEIGEGNVTGIVIRLPAEPDELCVKL